MPRAVPSPFRISVVVIVLMMSVGSACSRHGRGPDQQLAAVQAYAAQAFPESLSSLAKRPGVTVTELKRGYGPQAVPPRMFVRVSAPAAKGDLSFPAMLRRLAGRGWSLASTDGSSGACSPEPQPLPCVFDQQSSHDGSIRIVPLAGGGYELTSFPDFTTG